MKTLEAILENLSNEQLKEAFDEITEWRKSGVLKMDGIVRLVRKEFNEANHTDLSIYAMDTPFLYEIAQRFYGKNGNSQ